MSLINIIDKIKKAAENLFKIIQPTRSLIEFDPIEDIMRLKVGISWSRYLEGVGDYGKKLALQFDYFEHTVATGTSTLQQKFSREEVTFERYNKILVLSQQLLIDNFKKMIPLLDMLDKMGAGECLDKKQFYNQVEALYTINQDLLNKLSTLILELSKLKNLRGPEVVALDQLLSNLATLSERAKQYQ